MELYHATTKTYQIGETYFAKDYKGYNHFYNSLSEEKKEVELKLDNFRPQDTPERKTSIFFFDNPNYCSYYCSKQYPKVPIHVYKVNVPDAKGGFPICIVHFILKNIRNIELIDRMIDEYWNPKKDWNILEYLGKQMTIIEECETTNNIVSVSMLYNVDVEQASSIR